MDLGLKGKIALVLGAGGGLGGAIAKTLAAEGAQIAVADINKEAAEKTVADIRTAGGSAMALEWDLAELGVIEPNLAAIEKQLGSVDVLVNITGGPPPTLVSGQSADSWRKYFDSMVLSVIAISDAVLPKMREKKWGRIITSTSSGVVAPIPNLGLSNSLRMSLLGWSKTLAGEVGRDGVTVNIVLPGRVATQRITFLDEQKAKREGKAVEEVSAASTASIPVGRYGQPQEYADVVAFMASSRASYLTGSVIRVDGGLISSV
ncbi:SDR family oxidoreductase [Rhizobium sophorae]|uniref:SDR family oxidoreductase n=1 Tax=Rhizobium sophorae TaxID=1535242 RepID=A0A7Y3S853_9HYPH|nr:MULTISPECIES: SDR family oxidoreductase [Rhizobium]MBX4863243.1 SDR family oxidoreductase [Rhizobium bangladeshense]NKK73859.1 SDR family oxidoreductase [Rhizobium leguminosarum bv. viciae]MCV9945074.1 SDR family oxidoreductase [Rhizobium sp. BT-175]NKL36844.1 SDR family oxidoreductase [Rhizobium leguminosarum bv. viciae]NNU38662.1 SDR family oxidoreductase [Rhizobium sophorae]